MWWKKLKVRLNKKEVEIIKELSKNIFGESEIYIFGSRLKDKRGGDIDIFIIPKKREKLFEKKLKLSAKLENILGKPVDIIVSKDFNREIEKEALKGIKL